MGKPCGCGNAGIVVRCGVGLRCSGVGSSSDPLTVEWQIPLAAAACEAVMDCVGANLTGGLVYNSTTRKIGVGLSSDSGNSIIFGSDGGLFSAGGGGGGETGFATVDGLKARTTPIVGGSYGAGISQWPEGSIQSYEVAMNLRLPLIHVPVRRSAEFVLWAIHHRQMTAYNYITYQTAFDRSDTLSQAAGDKIRFIPGGDPPPTGSPQDEYWGYLWPPHTGVPRLADVLNIVNRRAVVYLEVKDVGASVGDTPDPQSTFGVLAELLTAQGYTKSAIVGVELREGTSTSDLAQLAGGVKICRDAGIAVALHLSSAAQVNTYTVPIMQQHGFTWAFVAYHLVDAALADSNAQIAANIARIKEYKAAGIQVLLHSAHRQWHFNLATDTAVWGDGALKGVISFDPVYCGGKTNGYSYRKVQASWHWRQPYYGLHSPWSANPVGVNRPRPKNDFEGQREKVRGFCGDSGWLRLEVDVIPPNYPPDSSLINTGYMLLIGEQCPVPLNAATNKHDSYDIDLAFLWDRITDRGRWMSVFFAVPEDRSLTEWTDCTKFTKGYQVQLNMAGDLVFQRYDGIPYSGSGSPTQFEEVWSYGSSIAAGTAYGIKVRVRTDRIIVGPSSQQEGGPNTRVFRADKGGTIHRGPYAYIGRHFFSTSPDNASSVRWWRPTITPA